MFHSHQSAREGWHRRIHLLPHSMHRSTTAAHVLGTCLLLSLPLQLSFTTLWAVWAWRVHTEVVLCSNMIEIMKLSNIIRFTHPVWGYADAWRLGILVAQLSFGPFLAFFYHKPAVSWFGSHSPVL